MKNLVYDSDVLCQNQGTEVQQKFLIAMFFNKKKSLAITDSQVFFLVDYRLQNQVVGQ